MPSSRNLPDAAEDLRLEADGAEQLGGAVAALLPDIERALAGLPSDRAGVRVHGVPQLAVLLHLDGAVGRLAGRYLAGAQPVRAILFDKSSAANWSLGWHQDRTIVVRERTDTPGFGPWSRKRGLLHVEPPFPILASMLTLRLHLDPVDHDNGPLMVAPGSHRLGRLAEPEIDDVVVACGVAVCLAAAGDAWVYATPILHASRAAVRPSRRRVLQVDYARCALPGGLSWLGV